MTLPASQQRALDAIDDVLQSAEPRLATMFGVFTDLTRLDAMPAAETLHPAPWWARHRLTRSPVPARLVPASLAPARAPPPPGRPAAASARSAAASARPRRPLQAGRRLSRIVLIPLLLLAAASLVVVSLVSSGPGGRRGCSQAVAAVMAARLRGAVTASAGPGGAGCPSGGAQPVFGGR